MWKTDTQKNKAELERVAFYHCDQVGTPQTLSNELGECIWEIKQDTWGTTQEIKTANESNPLEQSNLRFQGQYYDKETGLHYNRYRYYEPYSARYVSKDPIGLFGGLNNSVYVSDPNQWIDPMGLMGDKEKNASDYDRYSKIANAHYAKEKADDAKALAKLKAAREVVKINDARYEQQNRPSTGILGALLPGTMSSFAKNKQDANVLRNRQGMRNVGTVGAAVAASPYALSSPIGGAMAPAETATVYTAATNSVASTMIKGGAVSVALDGSVQAYKSIDCLCNAYSAKQSAGAFVGGAAGGAFAGKMLKTANYLNLRAKDAKVITQVGALNISKNLNNPVGITTWLNSALIGATSGSIAKDVFKSDKKEKK